MNFYKDQREAYKTSIWKIKKIHSVSMVILNQFYVGFDRGLLNQKPKIEVAVPVELKEC